MPKNKASSIASNRQVCYISFIITACPCLKETMKDQKYAELPEHNNRNFYFNYKKKLICTVRSKLPT